MLLVFSRAQNPHDISISSVVGLVVKKLFVKHQSPFIVAGGQSISRFSLQRFLPFGEGRFPRVFRGSRSYRWFVGRFILGGRG